MESGAALFCLLLFLLAPVYAGLILPMSVSGAARHSPDVCVGGRTATNSLNWLTAESRHCQAARVIYLFRERTWCKCVAHACNQNSLNWLTADAQSRHPRAPRSRPLWAKLDPYWSRLGGTLFERWRWYHKLNLFERWRWCGRLRGNLFQRWRWCG